MRKIKVQKIKLEKVEQGKIQLEKIELDNIVNEWNELTLAIMCNNCHLCLMFNEAIRIQSWFSYQGLISSTFYEQLLHLKIPKEQKDTDKLTEFLPFWDLQE